jgi:hypothetical protein
MDLSIVLWRILGTQIDESNAAKAAKDRKVKYGKILLR